MSKEDIPAMVSAPQGSSDARVYAPAPRFNHRLEGVRHEETETDVIWLLVLLLLILAVGGGVALSKFLFLLLVVALVLALFGAFGRTV